MVLCGITFCYLGYISKRQAYKNEMKKRIRRAVVTGAASGVGKEVTKILSSQDWIIFACDIDSKGLTTANYPPNVTTFSLDVRDVKSCEDLAELVGRDGGSLDALINVAGIVQAGPAIGFNEEQSRMIFEVNTFAPMRLTRLLVPIMLRTKYGGYVVNVTSVNSKVAWPWSGLYGSTKAALHLFSESLGRESFGNGLPLRVTCVAPGPVDTPMADTQSERMKEWALKNRDSPFVKACEKEADFQLKMKAKGWGVQHVAISPTKVAEVILSILQDPSPSSFYLVCSPAFAFIYYFALYLPRFLADRLLLAL